MANPSENESTDACLQRMSFAEYRVIERARDLTSREAKILGSIDWHGLEPTEVTWTMLRAALKPALIAEEVRAKKAALARRGATVTRLAGGCDVYRVAAWQAPSNAVARSGTKRPKGRPKQG